MLGCNTFAQKTSTITDRGFEKYNLVAHRLEKTNMSFLVCVRQNERDLQIKETTADGIGHFRTSLAKAAEIKLPCQKHRKGTPGTEVQPVLPMY